MADLPTSWGGGPPCAASAKQGGGRAPNGRNRLSSPTISPSPKRARRATSPPERGSEIWQTSPHRGEGDRPAQPRRSRVVEGLLTAGTGCLPPPSRHRPNGLGEPPPPLSGGLKYGRPPHIVGRGTALRSLGEAGWWKGS